MRITVKSFLPTAVSRKCRHTRLPLRQTGVLRPGQERFEYRCWQYCVWLRIVSRKCTVMFAGSGSQSCYRSLFCLHLRLKPSEQRLVRDLSERRSILRIGSRRSSISIEVFLFAFDFVEEQLLAGGGLVIVYVQFDPSHSPDFERATESPRGK